MRDSFYVIAGGGVGAYLRYRIHTWIEGRTHTPFPYGTLVINLTGAFLIGLLMTVLIDHFEINPHWRLFLIVGVLGGYTTFSTFSWETYQLFSVGNYLHGSLYILGSILGGTLGVFLGVWAGQLL